MVKNINDFTAVANLFLFILIRFEFSSIFRDWFINLCKLTLHIYTALSKSLPVLTKSCLYLTQKFEILRVNWLINQFIVKVGMYTFYKETSSRLFSIDATELEWLKVRSAKLWCTAITGSIVIRCRNA